MRSALVGRAGFSLPLMTRSHLLTTMMMERPLSCAYPAMEASSWLTPSVASMTRSAMSAPSRCFARHDDRELFGHQVRLAFAADAGGIDEAESASVVLDDFVDCVARGARGRRDDRPV